MPLIKKCLYWSNMRQTRMLCVFTYKKFDFLYACEQAMIINDKWDCPFSLFAISCKQELQFHVYSRLQHTKILFQVHSRLKHGNATSVFKIETQCKILTILINSRLSSFKPVRLNTHNSPCYSDVKATIISGSCGSRSLFNSFWVDSYNCSVVTQTLATYNLLWWGQTNCM